MPALHRRPSSLLAVGAGGVVGTALRDLAERSAPAPAGGWPGATLTVNLLGALALGALLEHLARRGPDVGQRRTLRLLLGTGFCGGLTTFSTLAVETDLLVRGGRPGVAGAYLVTSLVAGAAAAAAGAALARRTTSPRRAR